MVSNTTLQQDDYGFEPDLTFQVPDLLLPCLHEFCAGVSLLNSNTCNSDGSF